MLNILFEEDSPEEISIGLLKNMKNIPDYEFFYKINELNLFQFSRIEDFKIYGSYYHYYFNHFKGHDLEQKSFIHIIQNVSYKSKQKKEISELFITEENSKYLIPEYKNVDYIIKSTDLIHDFSLILQPEIQLFTIQNFILKPTHELYPIITTI